VRFDPAPGAILSAAPASIIGWFSNDLRRDPANTFLHVIDAQNRRVDQGEPVLSTDRRQMSVTLAQGLAEGAYLVHYSALDDGDGHTTSGCYVFFVGQAAADAAVRGGDQLDGGSRCPTLAATPAPGSDDGAASSENFAVEDGRGVPVWALIAGALGGVALGFISGRLLAARP
jgi:methionine-rich copper-binding protein CopC